VQDEQIYALLTEIFHEIFANDTIVLAPAMTADDVEGWDSFAHLDIIVALEEQLGIKFTTREIETLRTVGDLVALVKAKAGAAHI